MAKGQGSVEVIIMLALALTFILFIYSQSNQSIIDLQKNAELSQGQTSLDDLAAAARDVYFQGTMCLVPFENHARVAHRGAGKRAHRSSRNRVYADSIAPQIRCEIAHRGLQRRLGNTHHIIIRHDPRCTAIGERQYRTTLAAIFF